MSWRTEWVLILPWFYRLLGLCVVGSAVLLFYLELALAARRRRVLYSLRRIPDPQRLGALPRHNRPAVSRCVPDRARRDVDLRHEQRCLASLRFHPAGLRERLILCCHADCRSFLQRSFRFTSTGQNSDAWDFFRVPIHSDSRTPWTGAGWWTAGLRRSCAAARSHCSPPRGGQKEFAVVRPCIRAILRSYLHDQADSSTAQPRAAAIRLLRLSQKTGSMVPIFRVSLTGISDRTCYLDHIPYTRAGVWRIPERVPRYSAILCQSWASPA